MGSTYSRHKLKKRAIDIVLILALLAIPFLTKTVTYQ